MQRHARPQPRHVILHELHDPAVGRRIIAPEPVNFAGKKIAHDPERHVEVTVEDRRGRHALVLAQDRAPQLGQKRDVALDFAPADAFARGAHDEPALRRPQFADVLAQPRPFLGAGDAPRHSDVIAGRREDQMASRQRDRRGQPRALGAHRLLGDLYDDVLAATQLLLDR